MQITYNVAEQILSEAISSVNIVFYDRKFFFVRNFNCTLLRVINYFILYLKKLINYTINVEKKPCKSPVGGTCNLIRFN